MTITTDTVMAVVGVSRDKSKYGYKVWKSLVSHGYMAIPVNPHVEMVDEAVCYASLGAIPHHVEVVVSVVPPSVTEHVVDECGKLGIVNIWMQPGSESAKAISRAKTLGMEVVADACLVVDGLRVEKSL